MTLRPILLPLALAAAWASGIPAVKGVITVQARAVVPVGETPAVSVSAADRDAAFVLECTVGEEVVKHSTGVVPAGEVRTVALPRRDAITSGSCAVVATFANGLAEQGLFPLNWTFAPQEEKKPAAPRDE
jgi:MFS superfamily sulfate permease-like transporter